MSARWTEEDLKRLEARRNATAKAPKGTKKYRNQPVDVGGLIFDSKKEGARWLELTLMQRVGKITGLRRQVRFALVVNQEHICDYVADFVYEKDGERIVEDVKSVATKTPLYSVKRKLMAACLGIEIREELNG